jgi:hypothetical protein
MCPNIRYDGESSKFLGTKHGLRFGRLAHGLPVAAHGDVVLRTAARSRPTPTNASFALGNTAALSSKAGTSGNCIPLGYLRSCLVGQKILANFFFFAPFTVHAWSIKCGRNKRLIAQFGSKSRDESFKPNYSMISLKCYSNPHVLMTA